LGTKSSMGSISLRQQGQLLLSFFKNHELMHEKW